MAGDARGGLNEILLATDLSSRSDCAASRVLLMAKQFGARTTIVHVVDDDQPSRLIEAARREAARSLENMRDTFRDVHHVDCEVAIATGEAFTGVLSVAKEKGVDVVVIGSHRRRILKDVFTGTTAERITRESLQPVLMVNGPPSGPYRSILIATDMSTASASALRICARFQLGSQAEIAVGHIFDAPARGLMRLGSPSQADMDDYVSGEQSRSADELRRFLRRESFVADRVILRPNDGSVAAAIESAARDCSADLVVVGTHGRTGLSKVMLGSVTEGLMGRSARDILAVPPPRP